MSEYDIARELLIRADPEAIFRPQSIRDFKGDIPVPPAIERYFEEFGPVDVWIPGYGNPYFLPSLSNLWDFQLGYRFHGITHERISDWADDWLVIADEGGDPFIFSRSGSSILHAFHGEGVWEPTLMFDGLVEMVTTLAIIGEIVADAGQGLTDEDSLILPRFKDTARTRINQFLGSRERAETVLSKLGWA